MSFLWLLSICILFAPVLSTDCPDTWIAFEGSCYKFGHDAVVFAHSEEYCRQHRGHLVHIETKLENMFLKTFLQDFDPLHAKFWIGLSDETIEGLWVWYGTDIRANFTDWLPTEPQNYKNGEDCAVFSYDNSRFGWADISCAARYRPICEISVGEQTSEIIG